MGDLLDVWDEKDVLEVGLQKVENVSVQPQTVELPRVDPQMVQPVRIDLSDLVDFWPSTAAAAPPPPSAIESPSTVRENVSLWQNAPPPPQSFQPVPVKIEASTLTVSPSSDEPQMVVP